MHFNLSLLTSSCVTRFDWEPASKSAWQLCWFPLASSTIACAVDSTTRCVGFRARLIAEDDSFVLGDIVSCVLFLTTGFDAEISFDFWSVVDFVSWAWCNKVLYFFWHLLQAEELQVVAMWPLFKQFMPFLPLFLSSYLNMITAGPSVHLVILTVNYAFFVGRACQSYSLLLFFLHRNLWHILLFFSFVNHFKRLSLDIAGKSRWLRCVLVKVWID